jgi:hypothetical protein
VRHAKLLGNRAQSELLHDLERQPVPDHLDRIEPPYEHQVRE